MSDLSPESSTSVGFRSGFRLWGEIALAVVFMLGLYLTSLQNYLLFHRQAEVFSIVAAFASRVFDARVTLVGVSDGQGGIVQLSQGVRRISGYTLQGRRET